MPLGLALAVWLADGLIVLVGVVEEVAVTDGVGVAVGDGD